MQHPDLRVTSEEKVLDAVLLWGANHDGISGWEDASAYFNDNTMEALVFDREEELKCLLPLIRFPFMSVTILQKVSNEVVVGCFHALTFNK